MSNGLLATPRIAMRRRISNKNRFWTSQKQKRVTRTSMNDLESKLPSSGDTQSPPDGRQGVPLVALIPEPSPFIFLGLIGIGMTVGPPGRTRSNKRRRWLDDRGEESESD